MTATRDPVKRVASLARASRVSPGIAGVDARIRRRILDGAPASTARRGSRRGPRSTPRGRSVSSTFRRHPRPGSSGRESTRARRCPRRRRRCRAPTTGPRLTHPRTTRGSPASTPSSLRRPRTRSGAPSSTRSPRRGRCLGSRTHVLGAMQVVSVAQVYVFGVVLRRSPGSGTSPPPPGPPPTEHHCAVTPFRQRQAPAFAPPGHESGPNEHPANAPNPVTRSTTSTIWIEGSLTRMPTSQQASRRQSPHVQSPQTTRSWQDCERGVWSRSHYLDLAIFTVPGEIARSIACGRGQRGPLASRQGSDTGGWRRRLRRRGRSPGGREPGRSRRGRPRIRRSRGGRRPRRAAGGRLRGRAGRSPGRSQWEGAETPSSGVGSIGLARRPVTGNVTACESEAPLPRAMTT